MVKIKESILDTIKKNFEASGDEFDMRIFRHFIEGANSEEVLPEGDNFIFRTFYAINRYFFDFKVNYDHWCQFDTRQDASYYGNWFSAKLKTRISYTEGDIAVVVSSTDDAFMKSMTDLVNWNKENDTFIGVDPGMSPGDESKQFIEKLRIATNPGGMPKEQIFENIPG